MIDHLCNLTAKTQRATVDGAKRSTATDLHTGLSCMRPSPADTGRIGQLREIQVLNTPHRVYETTVMGVPADEDGTPDVNGGDLLVLTASGRTFRVVAVGEWVERTNGRDFVQLVIQEDVSA